MHCSLLVFAFALCRANIHMTCAECLFRAHVFFAVLCIMQATCALVLVLLRNIGRLSLLRSVVKSETFIAKPSKTFHLDMPGTSILREIVVGPAELSR